MPSSRVFFLCCAVAVATALLFLQHGDDKPGQEISGVPPTLLGEWRSLDGDYRDRSIEIHPDTFTLGRGQHGPVTHRIDEVRRVDSEEATFYVLHYRDEDDTEQHFSVRHLASFDELRIKNQEHISWKRPEAIAETLAKEKRRQELREQRRQARRARREGTG